MKKKTPPVLATALVMIFFPAITMAQAPDLGSAAGFAIFTTTGAITNTGISQVTGNVGTNSGAITGFGNVNGVMNSGNGATLQCAADLMTAWNYLDTITPTSSLSPFLGNGQIVTPGIYQIAGNTTLNNDLTLDAEGNANAVFIFQVSAPFSSANSSEIVLINEAQPCNVFWKIEGAVSLAAATVMRGTIIAHNAAIDMAAGVTLEGRALSTTGDVSLNGTLNYIPTGCGSAILTGPTAPALGTVICYALFSGNGPVTNGGSTFATGDIGTNSGLTTGYDPLKVNGIIHPIPDGSTLACAADLGDVYTYLNTLPFDIELLYPEQFGRNLVLTPHTYLMNAAASFTDTLYLNAENYTDAVFVIKINGALTTSTFATVILTNGAQAKNIFWKVDGAVAINDNSVFKGTIVGNNGAVGLTTGVLLEGRALTTNGAVSTAAITVSHDDICTALPLSLVNFSGYLQHTDAVLNWQTASEQNTFQFEIEKSVNGINFTRAGIVAAAGQSDGPRDYSYTDRNIIIPGTAIYYRLKMTDADNRFKYSAVISIKSKSEGASVEIYPNPAKEIATIMIEAGKKDLANYTITDNTGQMISSKSIHLVAGANAVTVDVKALAAGVYIISIKGAFINERIQFVKL